MNDDEMVTKAGAREILRVFADTLHLYVYDRGRVPPSEALFRNIDDAEKMRRACLKAIAAITRSIKSSKKSKKAAIAKEKAAKAAARAASEAAEGSAA